MLYMLIITIVHLESLITCVAPLPRSAQDTIWFTPTTSGGKYTYRSTDFLDGVPSASTEYVRIIRSVDDKPRSTAKLLSVELVINDRVEMVNVLEVSDKGLWYCVCDDVTLRTPLQLIKLPHKKNSTWKTKLGWEDELELEIECTDMGVETVELPAGNMKLYVLMLCVPPRGHRCVLLLGTLLELVQSSQFKN